MNIPLKILSLILVLPLWQGVFAQPVLCEGIPRINEEYTAQYQADQQAIRDQISEQEALTQTQIDALTVQINTNPLNALALKNQQDALRAALYNTTVELNTELTELDEEYNRLLSNIHTICATYTPREQFLETNTPKLQGIATETETGIERNGLETASNIQRDRLQEISTSSNLPRVIIGYVRLLGQILAIFAVLFIVYAGYLLITQWTNQANRQKAYQIIGWVVMGILIVFAAYPLVIMVVKALFGDLEISP